MKDKNEVIKILQTVLEEWVKDDDISIPREEALRFAIKFMKETSESKMMLGDLLNILEREASIKIVKDNEEVYHGWVDGFYKKFINKELLNVPIKYIMQYSQDLIILI